ncbi:MAG: cupin domain-containing protein [Aigarchaeota archaeon]|nr:cupin domain-containing protein [Candidatus Pelearchaeum maunauluense]
MIRRSGEVRAEQPDRAVNTELRWLISARDGAPNFEMRKFTLKPGGRIPKHMHPDIEHEQYILRGRMVIGIGDEEHEVKEGDAVYIPAGTPHWYFNNSSEDVEFICVIPRREKYDTIYVGEC